MRRPSKSFVGLSDKTIITQVKTYLIISPQPWGKMYLSKHNYALELCEAGHQVFYLNPPQPKRGGWGAGINISPEKENLWVVEYALPGIMHHLRFKARAIFDLLINSMVVKKVARIAKFDEVWCFEPNLFSDITRFGARKNLLFIVDQHSNLTLQKLASKCDGIATISKPIMDYFAFSDKPKLLLNHGLNKNFTKLAQAILPNIAAYQTRETIRVAYVGNLLQGNRVDYQTMEKIVTENPSVEFHIFGPYEQNRNTLGSTSNPELERFISKLQKTKNVFLHGILPQNELATAMHTMDVFLTCYNYLTDYNRSSNCHKIIEYLSTGKVNVSNRIISYESTPGLLEMPEEYTNENLPSLFKSVISELELHNSPEKQRRRIEFALANTYGRHVETINKFLNREVS